MPMSACLSKAVTYILSTWSPVAHFLDIDKIHSNVPIAYNIGTLVTLAAKEYRSCGDNCRSMTIGGGI